MIMNQILINVAMFNVLSEDGICSNCEIKQYFTFDEEMINEASDSIPAQTRDLGYKSYNFLQNTGTISFFLIGYFIQVFVLGIMSLMMHLKYLKKSNRAKKILKWLYQSTFYGSLIAILLESYFEHLVSG